jgi:hypothetical protein
MAKRDERIKASDTFSPFLGKTSVFEDAFPDIESLAVESREISHQATRKHTRHFDQTNFGEYIDCSAPLCVRGGVSVGSIVREMAATKQTTLETTERCVGYEGSPKGRRRYGPCSNIFQIKVSVKYKETP